MAEPKVETGAATREPLCFFFIFMLLLFSLATADHEGPNTRSTLLFSSLQASSYYFDVYTLPISSSGEVNAGVELKITDGHSVNFNGHFPSASSLTALLSPLTDQNLAATPAQQPLHLVYVTERNGSSSIYLDVLYSDESDYSRRRSMLQVMNRVQVPLVGIQQSNGLIGMKDRPSLAGDYLVYVSTHENPGVLRRSWAAVYSTHLRTGSTRRLTPYGQADFSPAVSPSGAWSAVASYGEKEWNSEIHDLQTDIYVFRTEDGSERVKVIEHGGWPCWADDRTLYFHRQSDDGWWSVYRASLPKGGRLSVGSVVTQRVTPPGLHAFTPAASTVNNSFIAVATRRPGSEYRHIELFDIVSKTFREVTRPISPTTNHYNPFISPDSTQLGYHRCRARENGGKGDHLLLENMHSPLPGVDIFRIDGYFASFSPEGDRITYAMWPYNTGLYVVNRDGSGLRKLLGGQFNAKLAFGTAWDPKRKGVLYTSTGIAFGSESDKVDVISIDVDDEESDFRKLTMGGENNAFPAPSPDGKWIVFRSGRSGHKNLYIMDASNGEKGGLYRLTEGPWSDTMPNWSPDGDWIVFSSNRESPGTRSFDLYVIHPNRTGLRKLFGSGGPANHAWFSPDSQSVVFVSDHAGLSAEPISYPHNFLPTGEIFSIRLDGTGITRLTHNSNEDGTPSWSGIQLMPVDVKHPINAECSFDDCQWLSSEPLNHGGGARCP